MKFSGYEARTQLNTAAPHVQAPGNTLAYGTGGAAFQAASRGLGQISAVVAKKQEEDDTQDLLDARNKIMTSLTEQMYNSETGFMTNGYGENAKGLTGKVTEAVRNTFADVAKDYNGRVQNALQKTMRENFDNFQRIAASRESSEAVKMKGVRYETGLKNSSQLCGLNYNNDEVIQTQLTEGLRLTQAMGKDLGMTGEQIATRQRAVYTENIGNAVQAAINADDYARARQLLTEYKTDMDNGAWMKLDNVVAKQQEKVDTYNAANQIYNETGGDIYAVREMAEAACTKDNGYFDVDKYDRIIARVNALAAQDKKAERAGQRAARQRISEDVAGLMSPEELEDYRAEHESEWSEDEKYWYGLQTDLMERMYNAKLRGYKDKDAQKDDKLLRTVELKLQHGGKMSFSEWINFSDAAERLAENGRLSAEAMEDLYVNGNDADIQAMLTEKVEKLGVSGAYNALIDKGCEPAAAAVMIARVDDSYKDTETDKDFRTPEEIAQDLMNEISE